LRSNEPFFKVIVEQRQIAKRQAKDDPDPAGLEMGLKQMAASGAYGINAEINVTPGDPEEPLPGDVYADLYYPSPKVHDERRGPFANPILSKGGAMVYEAEILIRREDPRVLMADFEAVSALLSQRKADREKSGVPMPSRWRRHPQIVEGATLS
jgi:hypothetical protein